MYLYIWWFKKKLISITERQKKHFKYFLRDRICILKSLLTRLYTFVYNRFTCHLLDHAYQVPLEFLEIQAHQRFLLGLPVQCYLFIAVKQLNRFKIKIQFQIHWNCYLSQKVPRRCGDDTKTILKSILVGSPTYKMLSLF